VTISFFLISFAASVIGAICGIGGGVVIKPSLDLLGLASVSTISFLSSCTVLAMSSYSVGKAALSGDGKVEHRIATPLAIGAVLGGIAGQRLFQAIKASSPYPNRVGAIQSACLVLMTAGTLAYTLRKRSIKTHSVSGPPACVSIGLALGLASSFLGIGGGPINLVVLYYFFSLETKSAAQNSLYVILFSQIANIASILIAGTVPPFDTPSLALMVAGGVGGGIVGRMIYRRMDNRAVERLFMILMAVIIGISLYNAVRYSIS
jgi:uncharacterized protein